MRGLRNPLPCVRSRAMDGRADREQAMLTHGSRLGRKEMAKKPKAKAKKLTATKKSGGGKGATIIEMLRRKEGVTLIDLTKATGWQPHSVRGFLSAQVGKKLGLKLVSTKRE